MIEVFTSVTWRPMSVEQEGSSTRPQTTEELLRDHAKGLEAGLQELAVTGRAFTVLRRSEAMDRLLYFTRIQALRIQRSP